MELYEQFLDPKKIIVVPNQRLQQWVLTQWIRSHQRPIFEFLCVTDRQIAQQSFLTDPVLQSYRMLDDVQATLWISEMFRSEFQPEIRMVMAQATYRAYQKMVRFRVPFEKILNYLPNPAQKGFLSRIQKILARAEKEKILFPDAVLERLCDHSVEFPSSWKGRSFYWYGFDEWSPLQAALFQKCCEFSQKTTREQMDFQVHSVHKHQFLTEDDEWTAAFHWMKAQPPGRKVAIVIPDLENHYEEKYRRIIQLMDPAVMGLPLAQVSQQISIAHGQSLSQYPLIQKILQECALSLHDQRATLAEWLHQFLNQIQTWDWLQQETLSSTEYQVFMTFQKSLQELLMMNSDIKPLREDEFQHVLNEMLTLKVFQPQSLNQDRMVLGLLEAAALPWDAIWLISADRRHFPQSLSKDPLIPSALQEYYHFPHAHLHRESAYLTQTLKRLFRSDFFADCHLSFHLHGHESLEPHQPSWIIDDLIPGKYTQHISEIKQENALPVWQFFQTIVPGHLLPPVWTVSQVNSFSQCAYQGWAQMLPASQPQWIVEKPFFDSRYYGQTVHHWAQLIVGQNQSTMIWPIFWSDFYRTQFLKKFDGLKNQLIQALNLESSHYSVEKKISYLHQNIQIIGRVDLYDIDQHVLIDIKTRQQSLTQRWARLDPQDWQGPIYALAHAHSETRLGLLCLGKDGLKYEIANVSQYFDFWRRHLDFLWQKWESGRFEPEPQDVALCRMCVYRQSCRYFVRPDFEGVSS